MGIIQNLNFTEIQRGRVLTAGWLGKILQREGSWVVAWPEIWLALDFVMIAVMV